MANQGSMYAAIPSDADEEWIHKAVFGDEAGVSAIHSTSRVAARQWCERYAKNPPVMAKFGPAFISRRRIAKDLKKAQGVGFPPILAGMMLVYYVLLIDYLIRELRKQ